MPPLKKGSRFRIFWPFDFVECRMQLDIYVVAFPLAGFVHAIHWVGLALALAPRSVCV
jgi:hypothetical protein